MIYVSCPYSHPNPDVRVYRDKEAWRIQKVLERHGHEVVSPVTNGWAAACHVLWTDWRYWEAFDRDALERCDLVIVLMLEDWQKCPCVQEEIEIATRLEKPIRYVAPLYAFNARGTER